MRLLLAAALFAAALSPLAPRHAAAQQGDTSPFRVSERFLENCDARADDAGERPPENYACLSYMAGLIEGYSIASYVNGNERPYCLPRPVSLVEMMDIMAVAIERGVPPGTPTSVVFHNILTVTFPCDRQPGANGLDAQPTPPEDGTPEVPPGAGVETGPTVEPQGEAGTQ